MIYTTNYSVLEQCTVNIETWLQTIEETYGISILHLANQLNLNKNLIIRNESLMHQN